MINENNITIPAVQLAKGGPYVSRIVSGMMRLMDWEMDTIELLKWIQACLDLGITTFDHADLYGDYTCEKIFGEALIKDPSLRQRIQLISKCGIKLVSKYYPNHKIKHYDTTPNHIVASVENSLRCFHTTYLDLLLIHRPDPLINADEIAEAFERLKSSGKVLHFGVSNFSPSQFEALASRLDIPLVTNQVEFSLINTDSLENGDFDLCQKWQISAMAWSPLGGGALFHADNRRAGQLRQTLSNISESLGGVGIDQLAIAWILMHPNHIVPILGTLNLDRLSAMAEAIKIQLSREQWFEIWSSAIGKEIP